MKSRQMKILTFISLIFITLLLLGGVTAFDTNNNQTTADNTMITSTTDNSYTDNGINNENIKTSTKEIQQTTQADTNDDISGAEEQNKIDKTIKKDIQTTTKTNLKGADSPTYNITVHGTDNLTVGSTRNTSKLWVYQTSTAARQVLFNNTNGIYYTNAQKHDYNVVYFNYSIPKQSNTIIDCTYFTSRLIKEGGIEFGLMGLKELTPKEQGDGNRTIGREFVYAHETKPSWEHGIW